MEATPRFSLSQLAYEARTKVQPSVATETDNSFISLVSKGSWAALVVATLYQIIFFPSLANFVAIGSIVFAWGLFTSIFFKPKMLRNYPLSTFIMLGFVTTQLYFPLIFTSLEGKPVVFNLELPYQVFLHSTLSLIALLLGHAAYRSLRKNPARESTSILVKLGFFDAPTELQLWLMGFIGLGATFYVYLYSSVGWEVTGAASDKAVMSLMPFSYAPFFIPFSRLYGSSKEPSRKVLPLLIGFIGLLFLVSIGRNSRGGFMIGFSSVGFSYAMGLLLGVYKAKFFTMKNAIIAVGAFWLFTGPIADIGTAMVLVRLQRHDITYTELISSTFEAFNDKEAIRLRRIADANEAGGKGWEENYLKNIFLARFCNIKFNDLSLVQAAKLPEHDRRMFQYSIDYVCAELPQPLLDFLGLKSIDKDLLRGSSVGDYIYYLADGPPEVLGWYLTGHFAGTGMAAFGWWYLLILGAGMIPIFTFFDKLFLKTTRFQAKHPGSLSFRFSLCGMLALDAVFRFLCPFESVVAIGLFIIRGAIQLMLVYFLVYHFTRLVCKAIPGGGTPEPLDAPASVALTPSFNA
jgi:hypothetical protein